MICKVEHPKIAAKQQTIINLLLIHFPGFFKYLLILSTRESDFGHLPVSTQTRTFLTSAICGALQMKRLGENKPEVQ